MKKSLTIVLLLGSMMLLWTGCEKEPTVRDSNSMTDSRDGNVYATITIENQTWMAENLRYNATESLDNPNNPSKIYGRLYDWNTARVACPSGWHLPSDEEWKILEISMGLSSSDANLADQTRGTHGSIMKSTTGWNNSGNGTNSSGFNGFPSDHYATGSFGILGTIGYFWSSTEASSTDAWDRYLKDESSGVGRHFHGKDHGISCRCIKD